jgi:hypothetical protein
MKGSVGLRVDRRRGRGHRSEGKCGEQKACLHEAGSTRSIFYDISLFADISADENMMLYLA